MNSQYGSGYSSAPYGQQQGQQAYSSRQGTGGTAVHDVTAGMNNMSMYSQGMGEMEGNGGSRRGQLGQGNGGSHSQSASLSSYAGSQGGNGWGNAASSQQVGNDARARAPLADIFAVVTASSNSRAGATTTAARARATGTRGTATARATAATV